MAIRYAHTNIVADDWRALADFYMDVFDCTFVPPERDQSGSWLAKGTGIPDAHLQGVHLRLPGFGDNGPTLEIFSYSEMKEKLPPAANRLGLGHLAFGVDDVAGIVQKVLASGGAELGQIVSRDIPGIGQLTFAYLTDPEGNVIEVQHWDLVND